MGDCKFCEARILRWENHVNMRKACSRNSLKAQGLVTVNKPVISMLYIVAQTWPLCSAQNLVDGVNPQ